MEYFYRKDVACWYRFNHFIASILGGYESYTWWETPGTLALHHIALLSCKSLSNACKLPSFMGLALITNDIVRSLNHISYPAAWH
jgi:hypothetical protein